MLMDIRHPLTDPDKQMLGWAVTASMPVHILLTKADKLKRGLRKAPCSPCGLSCQRNQS